jgi:hypothetical protein
VCKVTSSHAAFSLSSWEPHNSKHKRQNWVDTRKFLGGCTEIFGWMPGNFAWLPGNFWVAARKFLCGCPEILGGCPEIIGIYLHYQTTLHTKSNFKYILLFTNTKVLEHQFPKICTLNKLTLVGIYKVLTFAFAWQAIKEKF